MAHYNANGPENGINPVDGSREPSNGISRPFTLQESLPYSPQTSTVPFLPGMFTLLPGLCVPELWAVEVVEGNLTL